MGSDKTQQSFVFNVSCCRGDGSYSGKARTKNSHSDLYSLARVHVGSLPEDFGFELDGSISSMRNEREEFLSDLGVGIGFFF